MSIRSDQLLHQIEEQLAIRNWEKFGQLWNELVPGGTPLSVEHFSDADPASDILCTRFIGKSTTGWELLEDQLSSDEPAFNEVAFDETIIDEDDNLIDQEPTLARRLALSPRCEVTVSATRRNDRDPPRITIVVTRKARESEKVGIYLEISKTLEISPFREKFLHVYETVLDSGGRAGLAIVFPYCLRLGLRAYCTLEESNCNDTDDPSWANSLSPITRFLFSLKQLICRKIGEKAHRHDDQALERELQFLLPMVPNSGKQAAFNALQAGKPISASTLFAHLKNNSIYIAPYDYAQIVLSSEVLRASRKISVGYRHVDLMSAQCIAIAERIQILDANSYHNDFCNQACLDDLVLFVTEELRYQGYVWLDEEGFFDALVKPFDCSVNALDAFLERLRISEIARLGVLQGKCITDPSDFVTVAPYFCAATSVIVDYGTDEQRASLLNILRNLERKNKRKRPVITVLT